MLNNEYKMLRYCNCQTKKEKDKKGMKCQKLHDMHGFGDLQDFLNKLFKARRKKRDLGFRVLGKKRDLGFWVFGKSRDLGFRVE
jgi:hypothetical protein